jgi:hypothetical protein
VWLLGVLINEFYPKSEFPPTDRISIVSSLKCTKTLSGEWALVAYFEIPAPTFFIDLKDDDFKLEPDLPW